LEFEIVPFVLITIGAVLLISSARNTLSNTQGTGLYQLLAGDFTGQSNFIFWFVAILLIGALGYVPKLKPLSTAFMALVILVLFLKKGNPATGVGGGFFSQFTSALGTTQQVRESVSPAGDTGAGGSPSQTSGASGGIGNLLGGLSAGFGSFIGGAASYDLSDLASGSPSGTALGNQVLLDNPLGGIPSLGVAPSPVTSAPAPDTGLFGG
jgi:hypothetical protein